MKFTRQRFKPAALFAFIVLALTSQSFKADGLPLGKSVAQPVDSKEDYKYLRDRLDKLQDQAATKDDLKRLQDEQDKFVPRDEYKTVTTLAWATTILAIILSVWNASSIIGTWKQSNGGIPPAPNVGPIFPQATPWSPPPEPSPSPSFLPVASAMPLQ